MRIQGSGKNRLKRWILNNVMERKMFLLEKNSKDFQTKKMAFT